MTNQVCNSKYGTCVSLKPLGIGNYHCVRGLSIHRQGDDILSECEWCEYYKCPVAPSYTNRVKICNICHTEIDDLFYEDVNGERFHSKCHKEKVPVMCKRCNKFIEPDRLVIGHNGDRYHSSCITEKTETDPHSKSQHESGAKLDQGKPRMALVLGSFSRALTEVSKVGTYGAEKYSDNGWLDVPDAAERYKSAMFRHLMRDFEGEENDPDTDLSHLAHSAWNALAILELKLREK